MKIVVLNGSPKGDVSVTMQYVIWLSRQFPQHEFNIHNIAARIGKIEREEAAFQEVLESVREADAVLWAYPLYVLLVHADYKRFIELIFERKAEFVFRDKPAFQLTTSIHFFDHAASAYIQGICDDIGMRSLGVFSAEMHDLNKEDKRQALRAFVAYIESAVQNNSMLTPKYDTPVYRPINYAPAPIAERFSLYGKKAIVLADGYDPQTNLGKMVDIFRSYFETPPDLVDLNDVTIKGGCLGCCSCAFDNHCVYGDSDGVIPLYEKLQKYDIIVYALHIRDRYFSSRWKRFVDRRFYRTHQPILENTQQVYLISGPLRQLPMLREIIDVGCGLGSGLVETRLTGIATDEGETSQVVDQNIKALCLAVSFQAGHEMRLPPNFLGVGGLKILRDEMWGDLRAIFPADHKYYRERGLYDFPQYDYKVRLRNLLLMTLVRLPAVKRWLQKNMKENMIRGFKQVMKE